MSETRKGKNNPFFGKAHSEQTKLEISVSLKGRKGAKGRVAPLPLASRASPPHAIKIEVLDLGGGSASPLIFLLLIIPQMQ
jgi:hypothetical protein